MRVTLIDNYDSFTWNLVHLLGGVGIEANVVRNDQTTVQAVIDTAPDALILSPGPCSPNEAGICCPLIEAAAPTIPIFGVCLGLQSIGQVFGGDVVRAPLPRHGKVSMISHNGKGLFRGINGTFSATRYHSLVVKRETMPTDLHISAETSDGLVMAMSHRAFPSHGVQFHPESILSEHGTTIVRNFMDMATVWNSKSRKS